MYIVLPIDDRFAFELDRDAALSALDLEREKLAKAGFPRTREQLAAGFVEVANASMAQAIAQVCELTWQLRGQAGERQVENAKVGITANQGLFGHGSSVLCTR